MSHTTTAFGALVASSLALVLAGLPAASSSDAHLSGGRTAALDRDAVVARLGARP